MASPLNSKKCLKRINAKPSQPVPKKHKRGCILTHAMKSMTLMLKPEEDTTKKWHYRLISLTDIDVKVLNK